MFRVWDDRRNSMKSISHSQFSAYNECNLKWKLRYIDKLSKFSGSIHTVFGTAMHTTIQAYLTEFYNKSIKSADSMDLVTMLKEEMIKELFLGIQILMVSSHCHIVTLHMHKINSQRRQ